jgi:protein-S-isoprenylcysteine O-methyltransferase Ste14
MQVFTPAAERTAAANLARTCGQTLVFWTVFVAVLPWVIVRIERELGVPGFAFAGQEVVALLFGIVAGALNLGSGVALAIAGRGTPFPTQTARELVVSGPYRWLRNPMAVGGLGVGFAVGLYVGSWGTLAYAVAGGVIWHLVARPMEERDLAQRFGDSYEHYRGEVRCWIPRLRPYRRS